MPGPGLRERKKQRTREAIAAAALALFEQEGFHATTIRDIATAADVAPRTVSGYFPVKEQLVFSAFDELFDALEERLRTRAPGVLTADALRAFLHERIDDTLAREHERDLRVRALIDAEPALRAYERGLMERVERLVAEAFAVDLGVAPDGLLPHMVGAATVAAMDALGSQLKAEHFERDAKRLADDAMTFIGAGVRALRG